MKIKIGKGAANQHLRIGLNFDNIDRSIGSPARIEALVHWPVGGQPRDTAAREAIDRAEIASDHYSLAHYGVLNQSVKGPNRAWIPAALIDHNSYIRIRARTVRDNVRNRPKEVLTKWIAAIFVGRTAVEDQRRTIIDVKSVWHTRGLKDNGDRSRIRECIDVGAKFRRPGARLTSPNLNRGSLGIETDCPNRSVRARS